MRDVQTAFPSIRGLLLWSPCRSARQRTRRIQVRAIIDTAEAIDEFAAQPAGDRAKKKSPHFEHENACTRREVYRVAARQPDEGKCVTISPQSAVA